MSRQDASSNYYEYPLLIRAVWLYRPNLSPVIPVILHWDGLRFRSSPAVRASPPHPPRLSHVARVIPSIAWGGMSPIAPRLHRRLQRRGSRSWQCCPQYSQVSVEQTYLRDCGQTIGISKSQLQDDTCLWLLRW